MLAGIFDEVKINFIPCLIRKLGKLLTGSGHTVEILMLLLIKSVLYDSSR
jgi:hypothetical protein